MDKKEIEAISLLKNKFNETGVLPKKSDFSDSEIMLIKSKLGPWPRALEKAGLKDSVKPSSKEISAKKRKRAKQRRKQNEA